MGIFRIFFRFCLRSLPDSFRIVQDLIKNSVSLFLAILPDASKLFGIIQDSLQVLGNSGKLARSLQVAIRIFQSAESAARNTSQHDPDTILIFHSRQLAPIITNQIKDRDTNIQPVHSDYSDYAN